VTDTRRSAAHGQLDDIRNITVSQPTTRAGYVRPTEASYSNTVPAAFSSRYQNSVWFVPGYLIVSQFLC